jgi:glycerol-3-phosphate dehydrogenase (NAD(P)+)
MKLLVIGAGAWGTALAHHASVSPRTGHEVTLWARSQSQVESLRAHHENRRYLPGCALSSRLHFSHAPLPALGSTVDLVVVGTPMAGLRGILQALGPLAVPVAWLCKGFESQTGALAHEVFNEVRTDAAQAGAYGVLSGPSFAQEVAKGQPTALVAASHSESVCQLLVQAFHNDTLRVYSNNDPVGVEVGGAVKNVMAIATGLCDGMDLGLNARAALITRGLAEMTRLGVALGGQAETLMGLGGLGDLVLTATGNLSRNRQVGLLLAQGKSLQEAVESLGHVAEGVACARTVVQRATDLGIEMPIAQCVVAVLDGRISPLQAVSRLMGREPVAESGPG